MSVSANCILKILKKVKENRFCFFFLHLAHQKQHTPPQLGHRKPVNMFSGLFQLVGVWILSEWMGAGQPKQLQLVELGPGKGSLASDVLRVRTVFTAAGLKII